MGDLAETSQEVDETKVSLGLFCLKDVYEGSKNTELLTETEQGMSYNA